MKCKFCGKILSKKGASHQLFCKENPYRKDRSGEKNPMFGKTHQASNHFIKAKESGEKIFHSLETKEKLRERASKRRLTEEEKKKISEARKKYLLENPDKVPYRLNHSSKESYAELTFRNLLEKNEISGWTQEYPMSIYQLDFAFVEKKIDVEIDGNTHLAENVKEIDKKRDLYVKDQGWKVLRIKASDLKRDPQKCLESLQNMLR